jgi:hypothetical protein
MLIGGKRAAIETRATLNSSWNNGPAVVVPNANVYFVDVAMSSC